MKSSKEMAKRIREIHGENGIDVREQADALLLTIVPKDIEDAYREVVSHYEFMDELRRAATEPVEEVPDAE